MTIYNLIKKFLISTFQILPTSILTNFIFSQRKKKRKIKQKSKQKKNLSIRPKISKQNIHIHTHTWNENHGVHLGLGCVLQCGQVVQWGSTREHWLSLSQQRAPLLGVGLYPCPLALLRAGICMVLTCADIVCAFCEFMYVICHIWKICFYV